MINHTDKIYVAGNRGLVGSAIVRNLVAKGYTNVIGRTHKELDLTNQQMVKDFLKKKNPMLLFWQQQKSEGLMQTIVHLRSLFMIICRFSVM